jgi:hypothetical protein
MIHFTGQALQELAQVPIKKPMPELRELFNPTTKPNTKNNLKTKTR